MEFWIWEHVKESITSLCPIIGSVNWKRRATDDKNGTNPFMQFLLRTAVSLIVAAILSIGGGMLSAYIMMNAMEVRLDNITAQQTLLYQRDDRIEDRINQLSESWRK